MKAELEKAKKEADAAKKVSFMFSKDWLMEKNWGFVNWKTEHQLQTDMQDMNSMKSQSESLAKEYDRLDFCETNTNICVKFAQIIVWNKSIIHILTSSGWWKRRTDSRGRWTWWGRTRRMIRDSYIYWPSFAKINLLSLWPSHLDIQCNGHWKYGMFDHYEFSSYSVLVLEKGAPPCFPSVNNQMPELSQRGTFFFVQTLHRALKIPPVWVGSKIFKQGKPQTQ